MFSLSVSVLPFHFTLPLLNYSVIRILAFLLCGVCIIQFEVLHQHMCSCLLICCGLRDLKKGDFCTTAAVIAKSVKVAATSLNGWTSQFHADLIWSAYLYAYHGFVVFQIVWEWSIFSTLAEGSVCLLTFSSSRSLCCTIPLSSHKLCQRLGLCTNAFFFFFKHGNEKLRSPCILSLKIKPTTPFQLGYCNPHPPPPPSQPPSGNTACCCWLTLTLEVQENRRCSQQSHHHICICPATLCNPASATVRDDSWAVAVIWNEGNLPQIEQNSPGGQPEQTVVTGSRLRPKTPSFSLSAHGRRRRLLFQLLNCADFYLSGD